VSWQLENQNGLAGSGGKETKHRGLGLNPLAGFEVTTEVVALPGLLGG
jgi:hypothetical protein